LIMRELW